MSSTLKKITSKAKLLYKSGKYAKWTDAIKAASKNISTEVKKVGSVKKKIAKKKVAKKLPGRSYGNNHKDTKSHNVRISVVSGLDKITRRGKKTIVHYSRMGNVNMDRQMLQISKESKLYKDVVTILKRKVKDYDNNYESLLKDILYNGLQSGVIGELIYYSDTLKWYKKHKKDITNLLKETMMSIGASSPAEVFGKKWDSEDPFATETNNQNLLTWFSFEETTRSIGDQLGFEI